MPEVAIKAWFKRPELSKFRNTAVYNWLCALGGGFYIILIMVANLVGFSFGISGLEAMMDELLTFSGAIFLIQAYIVFTSATFFMFALRRDEERAGKLYKGY
jgi:hypothetical protein